jgi:asparagine synthase (glutamine-hydrolysing)
MCGIAGYYSRRGTSQVHWTHLHHMIRALNHRGPDEAGTYQDEQMGLGMSRLSIIDLSGGSQPIANEDSTMWIVFNGEIFNYPELRQDLQARGHTFASASDTEVILHSYEEWGPECLQRLNGQFSIAIWNRIKKELFLARDRVGILPLHYTCVDGDFAFASEAKALFQIEGVSREIDSEGLGQVFTYWSPLPGNTVFKQIHEVPPGYSLMISAEGMRLNKYWEIPFSPSRDQLDLPEEEISAQVHDILADSIRIRLRADVPVGCYLSGGLDSAVIASQVVERQPGNVRTFGLRFEEQAFDEGLFQHEMVAKLRTDHQEVLATNHDIGTGFPDAVWYGEKPLLRTAPVPLMFLSRAVKDGGMKVVLTGEGGDEIFGGYNIFRETKVRRFLARNPSSEFRGSLLRRLYPYVFQDQGSHRTLLPFFSRGLDRMDDPVFSHYIRWENTSRLKQFLHPSIRATFQNNNPYQEVRDSLPEDFGGWDYLAKAQYLEMKTFLAGYLLSSQGDRVAMANSIELRVPYLDHRLIEFMGKVPAKLKIVGLDGKHILKKAFERDLPKSIRNRPKHPFRAPISSTLLSNGIAAYASEMLSDQTLKEGGIFDPPRVQQLLRKVSTQPQPSEMDNMAVAGILSTQILIDRFIRTAPGHS